MILYEYEGKQLLSQAGIATPNSQLLTSSDQPVTISPPLVLKAQVLSGKRAAAGGIIVVETPEQLENRLKALFNSQINNEPVKSVLVEQKLEFDEEYYLSISYDTDTRSAVLSISKEGGTGIEDRQAHIFPIDSITKSCHSREGGNPAILKQFQDVGLLNKLINLFFDQDLTLLEVNPLIKTTNDWLALDAKIKLDDSAASRHPEWNKYPPRSAPGHTPTQREIAAKKIDESDYRGVAGSAFFDLPGDIAVMASGGGASLVAMDALIASGGHPANYTEYGGNPPAEKVTKLTQVVLDKPHLHGLWVVGALANFTNIYETLSGFITGLRQAEKNLGHKIDFPIVIRRAGPHDSEAREMLQQVRDFDLHLYGEETSITESAKIMTNLAKKYADQNIT